jgi:hypothetical protein|tara:strand:- start:232 stop:453 length:222 start_codon:yes stop_codon:yes gene_type:complete
MFTVEYLFDTTEVVTIDERAGYDDVEVTIMEDDVFFKQYNLDTETFDIIYMSYQQLLDIVASVSRPEGAYRIK